MTTINRRGPRESSLLSSLNMRIGYNDLLEVHVTALLTDLNEDT
jgi:hypothetical protein